MTDDDLLRMCWYVAGIYSIDGDDLIPAQVPPGCNGVR